MDRLGELVDQVRLFARERDWERFHSPKNLAMALSAETGEVLAEFQWLTAEESADAKHAGELRERVRMELADVTIYLLRLADVLDIDIVQSAQDKLAINEVRFPPQS